MPNAAECAMPSAVHLMQAGMYTWNYCHVETDDCHVEYLSILGVRVENADRLTYAEC